MATINGQSIELTTKETRVLALIVSNEGKVVSREQILNTAWGYDYYGDTRVVDTLIKRLRKKIMLENVHYTIRSIYSVGYKIERIL